MPVGVKIVLGLMMLWGVVYTFVALNGDYALVPAPGSGRAAVSPLETFIILVHALNALVILLIFSAIAFGLKRLPVFQRVTWVFAFVFFYPLALPAFWWMHIWRAPRAAAPGAMIEPAEKEQP